MSDTADRYRRVAGTFTDTARRVPDDGGTTPRRVRDGSRATSSGTWSSGCRASSATRRSRCVRAPTVDDDPLGAWIALSDSLQAALDDPEVASREFTHGHVGTHTIDAAIGTFFLGDILVHTWDLARAAGIAVTLDPAEVHALLAGMEGMDEALRSSGHYGPKVAVPPDADEQTRLIAFTGRHP